MVIDDSRISLAGSPTQVVRTFSPKREKKSEMITEILGTVPEDNSAFSVYVYGGEW